MNCIGILHFGQHLLMEIIPVKSMGVLVEVPDVINQGYSDKH